MNFNAPSDSYYWKIGLFGCFNFAVMLVHRFFECAELPFNLIYVVLQDSSMWVELRHVLRGVNMGEVTWFNILDIVTLIHWSFHLFLFTFIGIHMVLFQDLVFAKPDYCKELNERLGLK